MVWVGVEEERKDAKRNTRPWILSGHVTFLEVL